MERFRTWHVGLRPWRLRAPRSPAEADLRVSGRVPLYGVLALMVIAAGGFFLWARQQQIDGARDATGAKAAFIASSILHSDLRPGDLSSPVRGTREHRLDHLFREQILLAENLRASLIGWDGLITYSTDHRLIGQPFIHGDGGTSDTLDVRVPVALPGGERGAVFELSVARAPLVSAAQAQALRSTAVLALLMIGLYLSFLPVLAFVTNRIRRRLRDMKYRVREMEHQAFHDTLTGLPNRALFRDRVEQAIRSAKRLGGTVAVMVMDLDRFKEVNDTFGHQSGDQLLKEVGAHVEGPLRDSDTVARLGGDEFAILAPSVAGPVGALAIAERAVRDLQRPHEVSGVEVDVGASIGVALYPHHGDNVDALLRCADIALYVSKATGAPSLYALEHDNHSAAKLALGAQLRRAISDREITVYYQPETNFRTGNIDKAEALVRWQHPERGLLSPAEFLPVAEETGLIRPLTSYVLDVVLEQWRRWYEQGLELCVAVNITGRDLFDQRFAYEVKDLLGKWNVRPSRLELEITEQAVLIDPVRAHSILHSLSGFGVRLAIDDFGTGNSSLAQLKRLPVEVLKIDKSFVLSMLADEDDATIVRSTIELAHNLGLQVVAEGIESAAIWNRLRQLGCDIGQGYYLSGPLPAGRLSSLLERLPPDMGRATGRPLLLAAAPAPHVREAAEETDAEPVPAVS